MALRCKLSLLAAAFALSSASAPGAGREQVCTMPGRAIVSGDTAACYSDEGCAVLSARGDEPVRDYDIASAPYALARGKISAIVTSSPALIAKVRRLKGKCMSR